MTQFLAQLVTLSAGVIGGAVGLYLGRRVEVDRERRNRTIDLYSDWVRIVALIAGRGNTHEDSLALASVNARFAALAPADVVAELAAIQRHVGTLADPAIQSHVVGAAQLLRRHAKLDQVPASDVHVLLFGPDAGSSARSPN